MQAETVLALDAQVFDSCTQELIKTQKIVHDSLNVLQLDAGPV